MEKLFTICHDLPGYEALGSEDRRVYCLLFVDIIALIYGVGFGLCNNLWVTMLAR